MAQFGNITSEMAAGRGVSGGKIQTSGYFSLDDSGLFTLFLSPIGDQEEIAEIEVRLYQEDKETIEVHLMPFTVGVWSPLLLKKAHITSDLLAKYNVYWTSGYFVRQ